MTNGFENIAMESRKAELAPWVLIAGGFRFCAGMDKANAALAAYLLERKTPLHLVAHQVDPEFSQHPGVRVHLVPRPAGSFFLGEWLLDRSGLAVAPQGGSQGPNVRVGGNGGERTASRPKCGNGNENGSGPGRGAASPPLRT